jgi:hypothetical protein
MSDNKQPLNAKVEEAYKTEDEVKFAQATIQDINKALDAREQHTLVFNGIPYSKAYLYNQKKAINYAPPKNPKDDREVSFGLPHEKIIGLAAYFLKNVYKRRVKCYDENGNIMRGMGEVYDLAIEHSYRLEQFKKLIALIYWEVFTQGDAFILDEWEVKNLEERDAYDKDGKKIDADKMDYTYEFLDSLTYKPGRTIQTRRAISRLLDGRQVILANPEIADVQDQPFIVIEEEFSAADAEAMFGSLTRWSAVPDELQDIKTMTGDEKVTLFDAGRLADPKNRKLVHLYFNKEKNLFNVFLNGVMPLPRDTTFTIFHPRGNYPLTKVSSERLTGSAYSRSIPAKVKFNSDFMDWALKMLAQKFEQGVTPPILAKGKYTLTRDIFRGGQVTHGVSRADFEKADPDNKGVTNQEFNFVTMLKEIVEAQTLNSTTTGEVADQATATGISAAQANQIEKLGYLLDGVVNGFMDMAMRRAETIESKYTIAQKKTVVDGKEIPVFQNFTVNVSGIDHSVMFDDAVGGEDYPVEEKRDELFKQSFDENKKGFPTKFYLVNPKALRERKYSLDIEIIPERIKDTQLQLIQLFGEFGKLLGLFGQGVNLEEMKKEYLKATGRPGELFLPGDVMQLNQMLQQQQGQGQEGYNTGSFGKPQQPKVSEASKNTAMGYK